MSLSLLYASKPETQICVTQPNEFITRVCCLRLARVQVRLKSLQNQQIQAFFSLGMGREGGTNECQIPYQTNMINKLLQYCKQFRSAQYIKCKR